jgi:hypothetical protein
MGEDFLKSIIQAGLLLCSPVFPLYPKEVARLIRVNISDYNLSVKPVTFTLPDSPADKNIGLYSYIFFSNPIE